ncbi:MAG: hypothetical protein ABI988_06420, partial [Nitrospirota bacterium]
MAAARKTVRRTLRAQSDAKPKGAKRKPIQGTGSSAKPAPSIAAPHGFPIVGIGASAGGLEAMEEFFRHMPPNNGNA